jgi:hypothetical protein
MRQERGRLELFSELGANSFSRTMALGSIKSLIEMRTRKSSLGVKGWPTRTADNLLAIFEPIF